MPGVIRTRVGYAGGRTAQPTYDHIGDHSETVEIDYDPALISYADLLEVFWNSHNPAQPAGPRQYMAAVFHRNPEQEALARASYDRIRARLGVRIFTQILPYSGFHLAEEYHQKYRLQQEPLLLKEIRVYYPEERGFVDSTAAARLNAYVSGQGTPGQFEADIGRLGLSPKGEIRLRGIFDGYHRRQAAALIRATAGPRP